MKLNSSKREPIRSGKKEDLSPWQRVSCLVSEGLLVTWPPTRGCVCVCVCVAFRDAHTYTHTTRSTIVCCVVTEGIPFENRLLSDKGT